MAAFLTHLYFRSFLSIFLPTATPLSLSLFFSFNCGTASFFFSAFAFFLIMSQQRQVRERIKSVLFRALYPRDISSKTRKTKEQQKQQEGKNDLYLCIYMYIYIYSHVCKYRYRVRGGGGSVVPPLRRYASPSLHASCCPSISSLCSSPFEKKEKKETAFSHALISSSLLILQLNYTL